MHMNGQDYKMSMQGGMTLRDYFAAAALQGIIASNLWPNLDVRDRARGAYAYASAMLEARVK